MIYYIKEVNEDSSVKNTAGVKARDDVNDIVQKAGYSPITIALVSDDDRSNYNAAKKLMTHFTISSTWDKAVNHLKKGDYLIVQFPVLTHSLLLKNVFGKLTKKGVKIVYIIHDLDMIRAAKRDDVSLAKRFRINTEERDVLRLAHRIIVHNDNMKDLLVEMGYKEEKIIVLEIFDYLISDDILSRLDRNKITKDGAVIIAGTMRRHKAGYVYDLPENVSFNLFGVGYEGKSTDTCKYFGAFPPDELPLSLEGSVGLVWDGGTSDTCSGIYGEYLKVNNPHKTSLILASGIPVAIWKEAALAEFVTKNNCGIAVASISEIGDVLDKMSESDFAVMKQNAIEVSKKLCEGFYMTSAINKAISDN